MQLFSGVQKIKLMFSRYGVDKHISDEMQACVIIGLYERRSDCVCIQAGAYTVI